MGAKTKTEIELPKDITTRLTQRRELAAREIAQIQHQHNVEESAIVWGFLVGAKVDPAKRFVLSEDLTKLIEE